MNENIIVITSLISLGLLLMLLFWFYRDYRVDAFRQEMFELRDRFFDEASFGTLSFESPAYGMLRITMNGLIRYGHRLSLTQMLFIDINVKLNDETSKEYSFSDRLEGHIIEMSEKNQIIISRYHRMMNLILIRHLILSSPILLVTLLFPILLAIFTNRLLKNMLQRLKGPIDNIDSIAYSEGNI